MDNIRPISDLRNHERDADLSQAAYDLLEGRLELYAKLCEAEASHTGGDAGITHEEMMRRLRSRTQR